MGTTDPKTSFSRNSRRLCLARAGIHACARMKLCSGYLGFADRAGGSHKHDGVCSAGPFNSLNTGWRIIEDEAPTPTRRGLSTPTCEDPERGLALGVFLSARATP